YQFVIDYLLIYVGQIRTAPSAHRLRQITATLIAKTGQKGYDLAVIYHQNREHCRKQAHEGFERWHFQPGQTHTERRSQEVRCFTFPEPTEKYNALFRTPPPSFRP